MNILQISVMLQPMIKKAREEGKVLFHSKVLDKSGKPIFLTPDELELGIKDGKYAFPPEEWQLADPADNPIFLKVIAGYDKMGLKNLEAEIIRRRNQLDEKERKENNQ